MVLQLNDKYFTYEAAQQARSACTQQTRSISSQRRRWWSIERVGDGITSIWMVWIPVDTELVKISASRFNRIKTSRNAERYPHTRFHTPEWIVFRMRPNAAGFTRKLKDERAVLVTLTRCSWGFPGVRKVASVYCVLTCERVLVMHAIPTIHKRGLRSQGEPQHRRAACNVLRASNTTATTTRQSENRVFVPAAALFLCALCVVRRG